MVARTRLASLFDVRPNEARLVLALLVASAFIGVARVFAEAAANTLFLVKLGAGALPYLYMGMAVVTPLTGFLYSRLADRLSFNRLLVFTFGGLGLGLLALRLALGLTAQGWPVVVLALGYDVLYVFTSITFWGLAGRVFNVRQGKRLFGLIGTGEVVAVIVGGFLTPALVGWLGTANLLLLSAGGLAAALLPLARAARVAPGEETGEAAEATSAAAKAEAAPLWRNRYVVLLFVFVSLSFLQTYFLDNAFYTGLDAQFPAEERLAGFVGVFLAVAGVLTLLSRAFLTGRVISRFGAATGLLLLSALLVVGSAAAGLAGTFFGAGALVFWLIAATKLTDKVLGNSIYQASFLVLYQPLPAGERLRAQTAVESIVEPLAIGAAGLLLLVLRALFDFSLIHQAYALLVLLAGLIAVTVRLGREYRTVLVQALARRKLSGAALQVTDEASLSALRRGLESRHAGVVIYCLNTLAEADPAALAGALPGLLAHPTAEVRVEALARVESLGLTAALEAVRARLSAEPDPQVRGRLLQTLAALAEDHAVETVTPFLDDPDPAARLGAMVGLLRSGGIEGVLAAGERLIEQINSPDPAERVLAARALGEVGLASFYRPLLKLLGDDDPAVRRAALAAAGRVRNPRLWPLVVEALTSPAAQAEAVNALCLGGEAALPEVEAAIARGPAPEVLARLARVCGRIGGARAMGLLRAQWAHPDGRVRSPVLAALGQCGFWAEGPDVAGVHERLRFEAAHAAGLLAALDDLHGGDPQPPAPLLPAALHYQLHQARRRVFHLLAFAYDPRAVGHARDHLGAGSGEKHAYAIEVLDLLLPQEIKSVVLPVLEEAHALGSPEPPPPGHAARLGRLGRMRALAAGQDGTAPWVQACALAALPEADSRALLASALAAPDPLVRETAAWRLARLDGLPQGETAMLSTIEKVLILKTVSVFAGMSDEVLAEAAGLLAEIEYKAGDAIVRKGETGRCLYVLVDGRVRVHDGERTLNYLAEGAVFGEMSVLDAEPRSASATAMEDTRLFRLDQDPLYELMADRVEVARSIIQVLAAGLRARVRDVEELHSKLERLEAGK